MNEQWHIYAEKFNALSTRERLIIVFSMLVVILFVWWSLFASPLLAESKSLQEQSNGLEREVGTMQLTTQSIRGRLAKGVHQTQVQQLEVLRQELARINAVLKEKTLELIEPNEMFALMQQLVFADSKLKLTGLKRKQVSAVFKDEKEKREQPQIYRHVMHMQFEGGYQDTLKYVSKLEALDWKLIWDRISLKTLDYPRMQVEIELSTLSDSQHWVGL